MGSGAAGASANVRTVCANPERYVAAADSQMTSKLFPIIAITGNTQGLERVSSTSCGTG